MYRSDKRSMCLNLFMLVMVAVARNKVCAQTEHANTHTHCVYTCNNYVQQHIYSIG